MRSLEMAVLDPLRYRTTEPPLKAVVGEVDLFVH